MTVPRVLGVVGISAIVMVAWSGSQPSGAGEVGSGAEEVRRHRHNAETRTRDSSSHSYHARRSQDADPGAAGMRIGKMPNQRRDPGEPPSTDGQTSATESQRMRQDARALMTARPGVTAAGGITIELDDGFTTQVDLRPGPESVAECTTSRARGSR